jgi:hypothetical protein
LQAHNLIFVVLKEPIQGIMGNTNFKLY